MSELVTTETMPQTAVEVAWEPPMPPTDLIFDDGEPLESNRHRIAMNLLIRSLRHQWQNRNDFFTGGNMFIYYSSAQVRNQDFRGPDFFVVLDVDGSKSRLGWVVWEEDGRYPDVIVELVSPSTAKIDKGAKKELYQRVFKTTDYFVFDPFEPNSLQGWHLDGNQRYQQLKADKRGWLWCEKLGFWLGTWSGIIDRETAVWLRFYDSEGNLVLLSDEAAQAIAETEHQRAETEHQRAETEHQRAETERQRAETERQRAETEHQRAETERQHAETERQRSERLAARLRELGENPDYL